VLAGTDLGQRTGDRGPADLGDGEPYLPVGYDGHDVAA
jgi:hypothetical protein